MFHQAKNGFTLLELLIAVAIFSGLAVLALGIFARSASSSLKTNESRARTEIARTVVDQISSDLRYAYLDEEIQGIYSPASFPCRVASGRDSIIVRGFDFTSDCLAIVAKYPSLQSVGIVWKMYRITNSGALEISEKRNCTIITNRGVRELRCITGQPSTTTLLGGENDRYSIDYNSTQPYFSGISPVNASNEKVVTQPFLKISLSMKPIDEQSRGFCLSNPEACYTVSTSVNVGGNQ